LITLRRVGVIAVAPLRVLRVMVDLSTVGRAGTVTIVKLVNSSYLI
jgi:hypothetical protein